METTLEAPEVTEANEVPTTTVTPVKRGRGRPAGSKNKPKPDGEFTSENKSSRTWTSRKAAVPVKEFMATIVEPIMGQVAAKHLKKNLGLVIAGVCGRISSLYHTTATPPLQTFSADVSRFNKQPAYHGETPEGSKQVCPSEFAAYEIQIPVHAQFNEQFNTPQNVIDCFVSLCTKHGIDSEMFTSSGGSINLSENFIELIREFAGNPEIWGTEPLIPIKPSKN